MKPTCLLVSQSGQERSPSVPGLADEPKLWDHYKIGWCVSSDQDPTWTFADLRLLLPSYPAKVSEDGTLEWQGGIIAMRGRMFCAIGHMKRSSFGLLPSLRRRFGSIGATIFSAMQLLTNCVTKMAPIVLTGSLIHVWVNKRFGSLHLVGSERVETLGRCRSMFCGLLPH